jgi:hypothetical protein
MCPNGPFLQLMSLVAPFKWRLAIPSAEPAHAKKVEYSSCTIRP